MGRAARNHRRAGHGAPAGPRGGPWTRPAGRDFRPTPCDAGPV